MSDVKPEKLTKVTDRRGRHYYLTKEQLDKVIQTTRDYEESMATSHSSGLFWANELNRE